MKNIFVLQKRRMARVWHWRGGDSVASNVERPQGGVANLLRRRFAADLVLLAGRRVAAPLWRPGHSVADWTKNIFV
jgi:hypothetical protein